MEDILQKRDSRVTRNQQWMSQLCEELWDIPLYNLSIPGSHDTMTYCLDKLSPVDPTSSKLLLFLDKYVPRITRSVILRWTTTQTLNVTEQLDVGIRYLDLRIAHRPDILSDLYFVHGLYTSQTVEETLHEISDWLQQNPQEIVILGCDNLQSMSLEHHIYLINCIHRIFGPRLCSKHGLDLTNPMSGCYCYQKKKSLVGNLREMESIGSKGLTERTVRTTFTLKRTANTEKLVETKLIVCYDNRLAQMFDYLWPSIPYWWANTTKTRSLIHFLEMKKHIGRPDGFFVAGLNLTENASYILKHPFGSMKRMTLPKLPFLYKWVQKQHPGISRDATNIIAEDLIGSDSFVSAVIKLNMKLLDKTDMLMKGEMTVTRL